MSQVRVAVLCIEGTNCEDETYRALELAGAEPEMVHLNQLTGKAPFEKRRRLDDYQGIIIPGGFSAGDYIRAGAIFAARLKSSLEGDIRKFVEEGRPVAGICNGFQILVELGLLPAFDEVMSPHPEAVLAANDSGKFECQPTYLKFVGMSTPFSLNLLSDEVVFAPSAHAEGKFLLPSSHLYDRLFENEQVIFQYVGPDGSDAEYPWNPNGSPYDIAAVCNPAGNVAGMMPHPERSIFRFLHPDWTRSARRRNRAKDAKFLDVEEWGDGYRVFTSFVDYARRMLS